MSERPWIKHDGKGCPVAKGVLVDIRFGNGSWGEVHNVPALVPWEGLDTDGRPAHLYGTEYDWVCTGAYPDEITDWRCHQDPQAEADRVNARQAMFQDMARRFTCDGYEEPKRSPTRNPVRAEMRRRG